MIRRAPLHRAILSALAFVSPAASVLLHRSLPTYPSARPLPRSIGPDAATRALTASSSVLTLALANAKAAASSRASSGISVERPDSRYAWQDRRNPHRWQ